MSQPIDREQTLTRLRFTSYQIEGPGPFPFTEAGCIYHKIDLSDLGEPYLSAAKKTLAAEAAENVTQ